MNPAPIFNAAGDVCTGWSTGSKTYVCAHNSAHTKTDVIKVPVYVFCAYSQDFCSVSGTTVTIDFKSSFEADNRYRTNEGLQPWTFQEWVTITGGTGNLKSYLIDSFFVHVLPYGPGYENWMGSDGDMVGALMQFNILDETTGHMEFINAADANKNVMDYHGTLTTYLRFTPSDTNTYESISSITVNFLLP